MSHRIFSGVAAIVATFGIVLVNPSRAPVLPPEVGPLSELAGGEQPAPVELRLNIPAYRLDVYERGERTRSYDVAVGTARYPTPVRSFTISRVVWNPWWYPPPSEWAREEKPIPPERRTLWVG